MTIEHIISRLSTFALAFVFTASSVHALSDPAANPYGNRIIGVEKGPDSGSDSEVDSGPVRTIEQQIIHSLIEEGKTPGGLDWLRRPLISNNLIKVEEPREEILVDPEFYRPTTPVVPQDPALEVEVQVRTPIVPEEPDSESIIRKILVGGNPDLDDLLKIGKPDIPFTTEVPEEYFINPPVVVPPVKPSPSADPAWWRTSEFNNQYALGMIGVEHRYAAGATGKGTLGAIYDSGIDLDHEDVGRIRLDLSHYYNSIGFFSNRIGDSRSLNGHGTAVYGIAGASRNGIGIHGVAPDAQFMILKQRWLPTYNDFHDALGRVTRAGVDAMNNSWAWPENIVDSTYTPEELLTSFKRIGPAVTEQLHRTIRAGVSIVFATGNEFRTQPQNFAALPVAMPELEKIWIAVTALNDAGDLTSPTLDKAPFANACGVAMNWCLAAPGVNITTLKLGGGTRNFGGTSAAAPHVTGAILVLKSQFPELSTPEIHKILFDTAVDLGAPGVDAVFGHGALNLGEALAPQGRMMVELGEQVNQETRPLSYSVFRESPVTGGTFGTALSDQSVLVTDRYYRGYFANLGPRIVSDSFIESPEMHAGLSTAFSRTRNSHSGLGSAGFDLRFDAFGAYHDVTRIAHMDPIMALVGQTAGTGFSMDVPVGNTTLSMAQMTTGEGSALSVGAGLDFGEGHAIGVSLGQARERDGILGARAYGAFAGLNSETVYGRVQADFALGKKVTLNGSMTVGRTSFQGTGLITDGRMNARSAALGLTVADALADGDRLSLALARPFAVSSGDITLRGGTGISAAENGVRTDRISFAETTVPLGAADRASELHLGYLHNLETRTWDSADLRIGAIASLNGNGGAKMAAARVALTLGF